MSSWQSKSHEALLRLLNNIGIIGAVLAALADIIFVVIMVVGIDIQADMNSILIFAAVNALIGILINVLLRYQGQKYAELENAELCKQFYNKRAREKKYMSMEKWFTIQVVKDILFKGCTTAFSVFGAIYITIKGSKNPIQLLITLATLVLFACFGLIAMNSAYGRFYNVQVPYMRVELQKRDEKEKREKAENAERAEIIARATAMGLIKPPVEVAKKDSTEQRYVPSAVDSRADILEPSNSNEPTSNNSQPVVLDSNRSNNSVLGGPIYTSGTDTDRASNSTEEALEEDKWQT